MTLFDPRSQVKAYRRTNEFCLKFLQIAFCVGSEVLLNLKQNPLS